MNMILRNLRGLWRNERMLLFIMIICVFSSSLLLQFSYGLYQNYHVIRSEAESDLKELRGDIAQNASLTRAEFAAFVEALPRGITDQVDSFFCHGDSGSIPEHIDLTEEQRQELHELLSGQGSKTWWDDDGTQHEIIFDENTKLQDIIGIGLEFHFIYRDGQYYYSDTVLDNLQTQGNADARHFFTKQQYAEGAHVVIITDDERTRIGKYLGVLKNGDTLMLWKQPYKIVGTVTDFFPLNVPFTAVPDDLQLEGAVFLTFSRSITREQYDTVIETANSTMSGKVTFEHLAIPDSESRYLYSNIMLLSVLIAVLSVINFVMLYHYILQRRSRTLAIFRTTGCTVNRAVFMYLGECLAVSVPVYFVGLCVYIPLMKHILSGLFPYMAEAYSTKIYAAIFGIYLITMLLMLTVMVNAYVRRGLIVKARGTA